MSREFDVLPHLDALRRYARTLARDPALAEDLVQEALANALEARRTLRPGGDPRAWLFSILHNVFVSSRRRNAAERRRDAAVSILASEARDGGQDDRVRLTQVARAVAALPAEQRAVLHLVAVEGLTYPQVAEILAIPEGTVMSRLSRARQALRDWEAGAAPGLPAPSVTTVSPLRIVGGRDAS